jgi:hypothetical protein
MKKEYTEKLVSVLEKAELNPEQLSAFQEIVLIAKDETLDALMTLIEKDASWVNKLADNLIEKQKAVTDQDEKAVEKILEKELEALQSIQQ